MGSTGGVSSSTGCVSPPFGTWPVAGEVGLDAKSDLLVREPVGEVSCSKRRTECRSIPRLGGYVGLPSVTELGNDITDDIFLGLVVPFPSPTFLDNSCARKMGL